MISASEPLFQYSITTYRRVAIHVDIRRTPSKGLGLRTLVFANQGFGDEKQLPPEPSPALKQRCRIRKILNVCTATTVIRQISIPMYA